MDTSELLTARNYLIEEFRKELLGPGSEISWPDAEHEIITDLPEVRYSVGILYPQRNSMGIDNDIPEGTTDQKTMRCPIQMGRGKGKRSIPWRRADFA